MTEEPFTFSIDYSILARVDLCAEKFNFKTQHMWESENTQPHNSIEYVMGRGIRAKSETRNNSDNLFVFTLEFD